MNDLITLSLLLNGPKHGYQLKREAGFIFGHGDMHNNLIYPLLRRFANDGWVTKKAAPGERGQTRQQYALTTLGHKELVSRLEQYTEQDAQSQGQFITRVGMFETVGPKARVRIIDQRQNYLQTRGQHLAMLTGKVQVGTYGAEVIELLCQQIDLELKWIERLRRRIHKQKSTSRVER